MNGVLVVDKPVGITSQIVISATRRVTGERRVGHCGTLDPLASGVLPVMVGKATKACEFLMDHEKTYTTSVRLGVTTDSEDITGQVLTTYDGPLPSFAAFRAAAESFIGEIEQVPPMYSALKQNGQKLVDLARQGITVERAPRKVTIHAIRAYEQDGAYLLDVHCSRGTYIRTLCAEIGRVLGCGACMSSLRRTSVGQFTLAQSIPLDALRTYSPLQAEEALIPLEQLFSHLPEVTLPPFFARLYGNGERIALEKLRSAFPQTRQEGQLYRVYTPDGRLTLGEATKWNGNPVFGAKIFF